MKQRNAKDFTDDQKYCYEMLADWAYGYHHLPTVHECGQGIEINFHGDLSTFDYDRLTRLVLLAHRDFIRIELTNSGPGMVKIMAHRRKPRQEGDSMWAYHPSLDDLIARAEKMKPKVGPFVVGLPDTQGGMCWLAGYESDPTRYYTPSCALTFDTWSDAERAIAKAEGTHPGKSRAYRIIPASEMGNWNQTKP